MRDKYKSKYDYDAKVFSTTTEHDEQFNLEQITVTIRVEKLEHDTHMDSGDKLDVTYEREGDTLLFKSFEPTYEHADVNGRLGSLVALRANVNHLESVTDYSVVNPLEEAMDAPLCFPEDRDF